MYAMNADYYNDGQGEEADPESCKHEGLGQCEVADAQGGLDKVNEGAEVTANKEELRNSECR